MNIVTAYQAHQAPNVHGVDVRELLSTAHAQVMHITLQPGEELKRHITPVDVFFYILEGSGIVEIGDEQREVSADMLVESPAHIPHKLANNSNATFRVLVAKTPRQSAPTKVLPQ